MGKILWPIYIWNIPFTALSRPNNLTIFESVISWLQSLWSRFCCMNIVGVLWYGDRLKLKHMPRTRLWTWVCRYIHWCNRWCSLLRLFVSKSAQSSMLNNTNVNKNTLQPNSQLWYKVKYFPEANPCTSHFANFKAFR